MHASRLVAILLLLQTRGQLTARELADELEVSLRTIYRDLEGLAAAGIPVYADRGPTGGYRLVEGYRTRLTGLNADEAEALFLSGLGGATAQLGLGTVLAAAQLKVLAAMPPELRGRASRVRERFLLVAPGWFKEDEELPALATIAQAVWEGHRIQMRYDRRPEPVERTVEPFGLVLKAGIWYLVARREGSLRTYRVSRILEATELEETFERPTDFDLSAYWGSSTEIFESSLRQVEVRLRVRVDALDTLRYAIGSGRLEGLPEPLPDDRRAWLEVTLLTESLDVAAEDLLRVGSRLEVLRPVELRERIERTAAEMLATYAGGTAVPDGGSVPGASPVATA